MKKIYILPVAEVVELNTEDTLLTVSSLDKNPEENTGDNWSNRRGTVDFDDEESF